jgi:hypothetical protein
MNRSDIRKVIRESFMESFNVSEGADGNYMAKQNIESIVNAADIINSHIEKGEAQDDWVEDKLSKVAENMRALRDFFEHRDGKDEEIEEGNGTSLTMRKGTNAPSGEGSSELEEGSGRSQVIYRGKNKKPANYPWIKK